MLRHILYTLLISFILSRTWVGVVLVLKSLYDWVRENRGTWVLESWELVVPIPIQTRKLIYADGRDGGFIFLRWMLINIYLYINPLSWLWWSNNTPLQIAVWGSIQVQGSLSCHLRFRIGWVPLFLVQKCSPSFRVSCWQTTSWSWTCLHLLLSLLDYVDFLWMVS